jgi:hypothetical protein
MGYAEGITEAPSIFSLGAPALSDPDGIDTDVDSDALAGVKTQQTWVSDSPFGRTLVMQANADPGAALGIYDLVGEDYLGQPMRERFTHVNGATPIIYGKKAFYRLNYVEVVTPSTNATTIDVGWGHRLGLPYKGDVVWAKENGILVPVYNRDSWVWTDIAGAAIAGGPSGAWVHTDFPGFIKGIKAYTNMPIGSTNDPAVSVEIATVAVVGLGVTLDVSAAAVEATALEEDTPTTPGYSANNRFAAGANLEIVLSDADAAVGSASVGLQLTPTQFSHPDVTDPATNITGDPRGTYESLVALDGIKEIIVGMTLDPAVNAAGNGGLHGLAHAA